MANQNNTVYHCNEKSYTAGPVTSPDNPARGSGAVGPEIVPMAQ